MNKFNIAIFVLMICVALGYLDLHINNYASILLAPGEKKTEEIIHASADKNQPDKEILKTNITSELLEKINLTKFHLEKPEKIKHIFNLVDLTELPYDILQHVIKNVNTPICRIYEIETDDYNSNNIYFSLKKSLAIPSKKININETNTYGDRSFYVNKKLEPDIVILVVKSKNTIYGYEYPKIHHDIILKIINTL